MWSAVTLRVVGCGGAALAMGIAAGCGGAGDTSNADAGLRSVAAAPASVAGYRVLEPGAFIAGFPADPLDLRSELLIELATDMAVGAANEIYVLDAFAKHVLRLDRDARLRAVIGRPGGGPGEFEGPQSIEADPRGGVWVADLNLSRLSRFDPDGHLLEEIPVPALTRGFAVLPDGSVLYRKINRRAAVLTVQSQGKEVDLAGELPPELAPDARSIWSEYDLEFAVIAPDTVVAFRNTDVRAYGAWRIALDIGSARIADVAPVAFPAWLTDMLTADAEAIEREFPRAGGLEGSPHPGAQRAVIPFSRGVRLLSGGLWITPYATGHLALATTIPLSAGDSASVVARGRHPRTSGCGRDYALVGGRFVELCPDQVRVYELLPAASGLLPFAAGPG